MVVGFLMCSAIRGIDFDSIEVGFPALLTMTVMPFTYSITNGIGVGFISYTFLKVVRGKANEIHPLMWVVTAAFLLYFLTPLIQNALGI